MPTVPPPKGLTEAAQDKKIHAYIGILYSKLRYLESYLKDSEEAELKDERPQATDIVMDALVDLELCIGAVDRIEEIVKRIK